MLRLHPILLGLVAGYLSAYAVGLITWPQLNVVLAAPLISLPTRAQSGWAFSLAMLPAFFIARGGPRNTGRPEEFFRKSSVMLKQIRI
jgi:xanthine/uracil permease